jgi:hypothetical protein
LLAISVVSGSASADPTRPKPRVDPVSAEARARFEEGSRLFDLGDYAEAIARFEEAYKLSGAPALLLSIAQAHRMNHACAPAAHFYRRFLVKSPGSSSAAPVAASPSGSRSCPRARSAQSI